MKRIKDILEKVYNNKELRRSIVPLFIGNPGLGKTVMIEEFVKSKGVKMVELITSQMSPFEISGIAMPDKDSKKMTYYNFDKLENLEDGDVLFFDELLNGNPVVLNACLTILEQRRFISGKPLPDIMIVAAANPQGMAPLTPQIKERFVWYDVKYDKRMWVEYMTKKYSITENIRNKLSSLITGETFTSNNFFTPRSIDKAVNMIIHEVDTPYNKELSPILSEMITNKFDKDIVLPDGNKLEPNESIFWLDLIRLKKGIKVNNFKSTTKDEFVLPKHWCISIDKNNFDEVNKYYSNLGCGWGSDSPVPEVEDGWGLSDSNSCNYWVYKKGALAKKLPEKYVEITLEQFRKHVLNK